MNGSVKHFNNAKTMLFNIIDRKTTPKYEKKVVAYLVKNLALNLFIMETMVNT